MAQLTWRNVDTPNFSGVTDALRLAGQSLTSGLSAGRDAITDFQKGQTTAESARLIAETAGITDPAALQAKIAALDPRHLTPEALTTALGRPQANAQVGLTQATTAGKVVDNKFNEAVNPLKLEEARLMNNGKTIGNAQQGVKLNKDVFDLEVQKKEHAAQPAYIANLAKYHTLKSDPTPASQAAAATLAATPDFIGSAQAAGVKGDALLTVLNKGQEAASSAVKFQTDYMALDKNQRATTLDLTSTKLADLKIQELGGAISARRTVEEDPNMEAELKAATLKKIDAFKANTPAASEAAILANSAATAASAPAQAAQAPRIPGVPTEGGPRAVLDFLTSTAEQNGLKVTSAFRDENHPLTKANPGSAHAKARAFDLQARTPEQGDAVMAKQREIFTKLGFQEGRDYKIMDEVRSPAGHATGPHIHVQLTAEGEARQKTAEAGSGNLDPAMRARQIINQSVAQAGARPAAQPAVQPGVRLETPQDLSDNYKTIQSMLSSAANTSKMDASLNPAAPIAEAFNNRPEKPSTAAAVVNQLQKTTVGDKDNGGLFSRDKLTIGNLNDAVQSVMSSYNVSPDIAGALIESAVKTTQPFLPLLGSGGRKIDMDKVKTYIDRFVDKDGKPKTELLTIMGAKAGIEQKVTETKAFVDKAKEEYLEAETAAKNGNSRVNVKAARERYANAQRAADAMARQIGVNPNVTANSKANTGR